MPAQARPTREYINVSSLGALCGPKPRVYAGRRQCIWLDPETGVRCTTILNKYNGRDYCLAHDHCVIHPIAVRPDEKSFAQAVYDELMGERLAEDLGCSDGYVNLLQSFPNKTQQEVANAVNSLRALGNLIEGRRKTLEHESGYRIEA